MLGLVLARVGIQASDRAYPDQPAAHQRTGGRSVVLLFTFSVSILTGLVFGLAPLMHTRVKGLFAALKEGGAKGATAGAARHHIRRGLVMAEVALAVMLVIGAGLLIRTVYNLSTVDAGFDALAARDVRDSPARRELSAGPPRAQLYQRLLGKLRGVAGVQAASAMSGLPPNRPLNANDTDIDNYTAPPEGPVRERRLLPDGDDRLLRDDGHSDRRGPRVPAERCGARRAGRGRQRNAGQHVLEGP